MPTKKQLMVPRLQKPRPGFYIYFDQDNAGCDYTIGCGQRLTYAGPTQEEAMMAAPQIIEETGIVDWGEYPIEPRTCKEVFLVELKVDLGPMVEAAMVAWKDNRDQEDLKREQRDLLARQEDLNRRLAALKGS